eukprot:COSAG01_NODE_4668_length_4830_cov_12.821542_4_plen_169_part_00
MQILWCAIDYDGKCRLKQKKHIMNEKSILQEMDHPFVIQLHATFKDPVSLYMVTEPVLGGELFSVLTREEYLEERQAQFYVGCIVLALEALHAKNNVYRDLKPENILLDSQGYVKVCDFGFAKKLMQTDTTTTVRAIVSISLRLLMLCLIAEYACRRVAPRNMYRQKC